MQAVGNQLRIEQRNNFSNIVAWRLLLAHRSSQLKKSENKRREKEKERKHVRHALNCCVCCESVFLTRFNVAKKEAVRYMEREKGDVQNC